MDLVIFCLLVGLWFVAMVGLFFAVYGVFHWTGELNRRLRDRNFERYLQKKRELERRSQL